MPHDNGYDPVDPEEPEDDEDYQEYGKRYSAHLKELRSFEHRPIVDVLLRLLGQDPASITIDRQRDPETHDQAYLKRAKTRIESVLKHLEIEEPPRSQSFRSSVPRANQQVIAWNRHLESLGIEPPFYDAFVKCYRSVLLELLHKISKPDPDWLKIWQLACQCAFDPREPFTDFVSPQVVRNLGSWFCVPREPRRVDSSELFLSELDADTIRTQPCVRLLQLAFGPPPDPTGLIGLLKVIGVDDCQSPCPATCSVDTESTANRLPITPTSTQRGRAKRGRQLPDDELKKRNTVLKVLLECAGDTQKCAQKRGCTVKYVRTVSAWDRQRRKRAKL